MWSRAAAAVFVFASLASGYYHYVHFTSTSGPWTAAREKFDLNALPNRTVQFVIHESAGVQLGPMDSMASLVSHIRAGARVWNDVATSDLRIAFGGIVPAGSQFSSPVIEVLFDEMPPGTLAYGGPRVLADSNGSFVPIVVSQVVLDRDVTKRPSYTEGFFGSLVHEFGHALGLQHTLTSSAMSTAITRATTQARPLTADDVAGLSVLYPAQSFAATTGAIRGRVAVGGQGVNLASVVALSPNGPAISSLTDPDGNYSIEGVPPGQYFVYAHSLPPRAAGSNEVSPANITYPLTADNRTLTEGPTFETQFFPGVRDPQQAFPVAVSAGSTSEGVDFSVRARGPLQIHSIETWGFVSQTALKPPYLNPASVYPFFLGRGSGIMNGQSVVPGLSASIVGGTTLGLKPYSSGFLQLDVDVRSFLGSGEGPRHVVFSSPTDTYVLPAAFQVSYSQPPTISVVSSVTDNGSRAALISGTGLTDQTRILFDGVPAVRKAFDDAGRVIAVPPAATGGHRATVVAINPDGQSSLFVNPVPATYSYEGDPVSPFAAFMPTSLAAGVDAMITIEVVGTTLGEAPVTLAFGTPAIHVRRVWTISPTRLIASLSVAPNAPESTTSITIVNGLQTITQPFAFQITPGNQRAVILSGRVENAMPGVLATATVVNTPTALSSGAVQLFLNDRPVAVSGIQDNRVTFQIPAGTPVGVATLRLQVGNDSSLPVAFTIDPQPPQITTVLVNGQSYDAARGVRAGDLVAVQMSNLADPNSAVAASRVTIIFGGTQFPAAQVLVSNGGHAVTFVVPGANPTDNLPLTISIDGRSSAAVNLAVR